MRAVTGHLPEPSVSTVAAHVAPAAPVAPVAPVAPELDLSTAARVCSDMARVLDAGDLPGLLARLPAFWMRLA